MNKPNQTKTHLDIENRVMVTRGEGGGKREMGKGGQLYGGR